MKVAHRLWGGLLCACLVFVPTTSRAQADLTMPPAALGPPAIEEHDGFHWGHALAQSGFLLAIQHSLRMAQGRARRPQLVPNGKLNILAADHPARRVTKVGDNPIAMADRRDLLEKAMAHLNDRERHILTERRLQENPTTLEDLSQQYGISRERVRQIEVRAFEKLQKAIKAAAIERRLVTH